MVSSLPNSIQPPEQTLYFACRLPAADRLQRFCVSEPDRHDFFMAYTYQDVGLVRALDAAIGSEGFKSWVGDLEALLSRGYKGNIDQGIQESDGFVLFMADPELSRDLQDEFRQALDLNKLVFVLAWQPLTAEQLNLPSSEALNWSNLPHIGSSYGLKQVAKRLIHGLTYVRLLARALEWERHNYPSERLLSVGDLDATQTCLTWIERHLSQDFAIQPVQREFLEASRQQIKAGKYTDYFQGQPPDVFISYSSKDRDFVKRLDRFLKDQQLGVWVDWENIPIATHWRDEVAEGIRAAHTFLFVISPDSVWSEHCKWELDQARQCGRRIIPLCCDRSYPPHQLETLGLSELSYVAFEELDFDIAANKIVSAIRTDLQDVKAYNRLYGQAYEWHSHQRSPRLLMDRKEFQRVQSWLKKRKQPTKPSDNGTYRVPLHPLQVAFLEASQKEYRIEQRQRLLLGGLTLAGFAATLAIAAYARLGEIKAMVASLEEKVGLDGLITALHAGKRLESNPYLPFIQRDLPIQTTMALHQETLNVRELNRLNGHHRAVFDLAFSPIGPRLDSRDGQPRQLQIVSTGEDKTVRVWSLAGPVVPPLQRHKDSVVATDFSSDGDFFVTGSYDGEANIWSCTPRFIQRHSPASEADTQKFSASLQATEPDAGTQPCQWIKQLPNPEPSKLFTVAVSPGSQYVAAGGADGYVRLWQRSPEFFSQPRMLAHPGAVYSLDFNLHQRVLVTADRSGQVNVWNLNTGTRETSLNVGNLVLDVQFSRDGNLVALGGVDGLLQVWDWQRQGSRTLALPGHDGLVTQVEFDPKHTSLASADVDGLVKLWSIDAILQALNQPQPVLSATDEPTILRGHIDGINRMEFSPDGRYLATASLDDTIRLWITADGALLDVVEGHQDEVTGIAFSPPVKRNYYDELEVGDYYLASSSRDGSIRLWRVDNDVRPLPHTNRVFDIAFSPNGTMLASSGRKNIRLWRLSDYSMVAHIGHQDGDLYSLSYGQTEAIQMLAVGDSLGKISLWRPQISTDKVYKQWQAHQSRDARAADEGVYTVQFSPNPFCFKGSGGFSQACLVSGGADGWVKLWSTRGELLGKHQVSPGTITSVSFTPDGGRLAVATRPPVDQGAQAAGQIYVLGIDNSSPGQLKLTPAASTAAQPPHHTGGILTLAFHPQRDDELISGGEDGTIHRWRLRNGTLSAVGSPMNRHQDAVTRVAYNPEGTLIASSSNDGSVNLWHAGSHRIVSSLNRHERLVAKVIFNPMQPNILASAGFDNRVLIWDIPSHLNIDPLERLAERGCRSTERYINAMLVSDLEYAPLTGPRISGTNWNSHLDETTLREIKQFCTKKITDGDDRGTARGN